MFKKFSYQDLQTPGPVRSSYDLSCKTFMQQSFTDGTVNENPSHCPDDP